MRSDSSTSPACVWLWCKFRKGFVGPRALRSGLVASGEVQPIMNTCALILKMPSSFYWLGSLWSPRLPRHSGGKQNHIGIKLAPFHPFICYYLTKPHLGILSFVLHVTSGGMSICTSRVREGERARDWACVTRRWLRASHYYLTLYWRRQYSNPWGENTFIFKWGL